MSSGKSCLRCSRPLPTDSAGEVCLVCTSNAKDSDTPNRTDKTSETKSWESPVADAPASNDFVVMPTDVAAAGRFRTARADGDTDVDPASSRVPVIDKYEIRTELGHGGGGVVYEALQLRTDRLVAVKLLLGQSRAERERFDREAKALAKLRHPAVVEVYEVGECDQGPYFSMELMPGGSLSQRVKKLGPLPGDKAAAIMETVARGMEAVHQTGLLHRDLKPGNILLDESDSPKIADFGLAKTLLSDPEAPTVAHLTGSHAFLGTPAYMSPEQAACRHSDIDARSDVYGLGSILFHLLTGEPPFKGSNAAVIAHRVMTEPPPDPRSLTPGLSKDLEAVCLKCLEKDPADRYQSAENLAEDLAAWRRGEPTVARPASRRKKAVRWLKRRRHVALALSLILVLATAINVAAMWIRRDDPDAELKKILKELKTGEPVVLVGPTGAPRWYAKEAGVMDMANSEFGEDVCCFESPAEKCVTLLREQDVPRSFVFSAEIRHERGNDFLSETGLFIANWRNHRGEGGGESYSQRISFNDRRRPPDIAKTSPNRVWFGPEIIHFTPEKSPWLHPMPMAAKLITPSAVIEGTRWRKAVLTVRPSGVEFSLTPDDSLLDPPSHRAADLTDLIWLLHQDKRPAEPFPDRLRENVFAGSLGLFVKRGKAAFRNVTIQQLAHDEPSSRPVP